MAVAKSYQNLTIIGEPYEVTGKMYVQVKNEKTGVVRQVRWYTDEEYSRMYKTETANPKKVTTQKEALGFYEGYITVFKGNTYQHLEWFRNSVAKYNKLFGWYISSKYNLPFDLPAGLEPIRIDWESVGDEFGLLNPDYKVKMYLEELMFETHPSEFQGTIGERITINVEIKKVFEGSNYYGRYVIHTMEDEKQNQYVWTTSSKKWSEGDKVCIAGTIKEHKIYRNTKQTILSRCKEKV